MRGLCLALSSFLPFQCPRSSPSLVGRSLVCSARKPLAGEPKNLPSRPPSPPGRKRPEEFHAVQPGALKTESHMAQPPGVWKPPIAAQQTAFAIPGLGVRYRLRSSLARSSSYPLVSYFNLSSGCIRRVCRHDVCVPCRPVGKSAIRSLRLSPASVPFRQQ